MRARVKQETYRQTAEQLLELLSGLEDQVAVMATAAALLHQAIPQASWTGFYRVVEKELLRIGPYQGPVGCLEIPFGRGVCGTAARTLETQLVDDVHAFEGHIACDPSARSEIVVPVLGKNGDLVAVLDIDSHQPAAFDSTDRDELESIAELLGPHL
jgi:GAF domain-containing protein